MRKLLRLTLVSTIAVVLGGCGTLAPDTYTGRPERMPLVNRSDSTGLLECLGDMLRRSPGPELDIIVGALPDATLPAANPYGGFLSYGGQMMGRTSLALLGPRVRVLGENFDPSRPTVVLRGEFTELDRVTSSRAAAATFRFGGVELEFNKDRSYDFIGLDLELTRVDMSQLPGMATRLTVIVDSRTRDATVMWDNKDASLAASAAAQFKAVGRRHGAQRLLIETGIFLLLSRYFELEAQACLQAPGTDVVQARQDVSDWRHMSRRQKTRAVQRLLRGQGYDVKMDGSVGRNTRDAIKHWQLAHGETPSGELSAELYARLQAIGSGAPLKTRGRGSAIADAAGRVVSGVLRPVLSPIDFLWKR